MNPREAYRSRSAAGWTRIDMLLSIYNAALKALESGLESRKTVGSISSPQRLRAQKLLLLLLEGVDPKNGETAVNIQQLLAFCLLRMQSDSVEDWEAAYGIVLELRDAFQGICTEARQLEAEGQLPRLDWSPPTASLAMA